MGFTGFVSIGISCSERGKDEPEIERPKPLLNMPEVYSTELDLDWVDYKDVEGIVYPKGTGKTPNPEGASEDGWFKIYRSGNDLDFKWQARTSDRDPHDIYVEFAQAKRYTMEISARSKAHGIDKFVLFLSSIDQSTATGTAAFSEIICL